MKTLILLIFLLSSGIAYAQIRAFDNSKAILPWVFNPSASFTKNFQGYVGYDGRGSSNFTPQSIVAGLRMPVQHGRRNRRNTAITMVGVQVLNTSYDIVKTSTINANFAHQITASKNVKMALGLGAGIFNMKYNYSDLVYVDQQDPLLNSGEDFVNIHLNAGFSLVVDDKLIINLATPYLIKDHRANIKEVILRISYTLPLNQEMKLITSANLDTYNANMIVGGDIRAEWKKMISILAGADNYKYHAGMLLDIKPFSIGYTYGQNYKNIFNNFAAHQISLFSNIPFVN